MNNQERIEFAKQQIDKVVSSGNKKEDVYSTVLNTAKDLDLAELLFLDLVEDDYKVAIGVLKTINKEEVKERLEKSFFSYLKNQKITDKTIYGLYALNRSYQEKFFIDNKELLNDLIDIDDAVYDSLISLQEHELYINYVKLCYENTGCIPRNTEKLKNADIRSNTKIQEKIIELEKIMKNSEDYDNLFFLASSTNTLEKIKNIFSMSGRKIYEIVKKKKVKLRTMYYAYFLDSNEDELNKKIIWYEKLIKEKINEDKLAELIITRYMIRLLELENNLPINKLTILPLDGTKKYLDFFDEDEQYEIFILHAKLFNRTYSNLAKYKNICVEDRKWNPFKSVETIAYHRVVDGKKIPQIVYNRPIINFRKNKLVRNYLEKEKDVLRQEAIILANSISRSIDSSLKLYFTSILHYCLSLDEFICYLNPIKKRDDYFFIYNTLLEGKIHYENDQLYLDTEYGPLNVSYTDESKLNIAIFPGYVFVTNISSYNYETKTFRIVNCIPKENKQLHDLAVEVSRKVRKRQNFVIDESFSNNIDFYVELCRTDLLIGLYVYLKNRPSELIRRQIEEILRFKSANFRDNIIYYFIKYILDDDKDSILLQLIQYIREMLNKYAFRATQDLTRYREFNNFRTNINLFLSFLKELDTDYFKYILSQLEKSDLLSITYWDTDKDYYKELLEDEYNYIREFYKVYPYYAYTRHDIEEVAFDVKDDLKFYLYLKLLSKNINYYQELEEKLMESLHEDNRYIEWIKRIELNIQLLNKNNLLYAIKGIPYTSEVLDEKKSFVDLATRLFDYTEELVYGNTIKELLQSINYNISEERLDRIKELSSFELTKQEKLELVPVIIEVLENTNCSPISRLNLLKTLGSNNPFYCNGDINLSDFKDIDKELKKVLNSILITLSDDEKIDLYFLSPLHLIVDVYYFASSNKDNINDTNYYIHGTVNVTNFGKRMTIIPTNLLCKENHLKCDVRELRLDDVLVIPHYDEISFKIKEVKDREIDVVPVLDYFVEDKLLNESLENKSFYESLYREEKEKVLMHYCRKDFIKAYEFDKEKIIPEEKYIDIAQLLSTYTLLGIDFLYFSLLLNREDLFKKRFLKIPRLDEKQEASLALQRKILEDNNPICFDRLILNLKDLNCLHDLFLLEEAKKLYKDREVFKKNYTQYNKDGMVENTLRSYDLKEYIFIKNLEYEKKLDTNDEEVIKQYVRKRINASYPSNYDIGYTKYLLYREIIRTKEIPQEYCDYIISKDETIDLRKILLDTISNGNVKQTFNIIKANSESFSDYKRLIVFGIEFPYLIDDIENLLVEHDELYILKDIIKVNQDMVDYVEGRVIQEYNIIKNSENYSPYNIRIIEYVYKLIQRIERYRRLESKQEIQLLINILLKIRIIVRDFIQIEEYSKYLTENQIPLIMNQNNSFINPLDEAINGVYKLFNLTKLFTSNFYQDFNDFCLTIESLNTNTVEKGIIIEEINKIVESLEKEEHRYNWFPILFYQLDIYGILNEEFFNTKISKNAFLSYIAKKNNKKSKKNTLKYIKALFATDETQENLYRLSISGSKKSLCKYIDKMKRYFKKKRFVKSIGFQKDLFDKYEELYYTLKLLRDNSQEGLKRLLDTLDYISILDKSIIPANISLKRYKEENLHSSKTEVSDADYYLLNNYNKNTLISNAKEEDKYYYYLVLSYWNNKPFEYRCNLVWNDKTKDMLIDFIIITLLDGCSVDDFFDSLKENDFRKYIDEYLYNDAYEKAVRKTIDIMQQKTEWFITDNILGALKYNPTDKIEKIKFKEKMLDSISEESISILKSYYEIEIVH